MSLDFLEEFFRRSIQAKEAIPEGYADISEILSLPKPEWMPHSPTGDFIITESKDKLTLFNADFAVWLVPQLVDGEIMTRGYIALHHPEGGYTLEMAFKATGEYNESGLILEALHRYLVEIRDTEETLRAFRFKNQ